MIGPEVLEIPAPRSRCRTISVSDIIDPASPTDYQVDFIEQRIRLTVHH